MRSRKPVKPLSQNFLDDYYSGMKWVDLGRKYEMSFDMIGHTLRKYGVPRRPRLKVPQQSPKLSPEEIQALCDDYTKGTEVSILAAKYDIELTTAYKYLKDNKISLRLRFTQDNNYFNRVDTEEKAYWLGFIAADGCTPARNGYRLILNCARKDRPHLSRFLSAISSDRKIHDYIAEEKYPGSSVSIASRQMIRDLGNYGIHQQKSYTLEWPSLPDALYRHYMRGYTDGDGSWSPGPVTKFKCMSMAFCVIGNKPFMTRFQDHLARECKLNYTKLCRNNDSDYFVTVRYGGNIQCLRIARFLYKGATIYMERKHNIIHTHYSSLQKYREEIDDIMGC